MRARICYMRADFDVYAQLYANIAVCEGDLTAFLMQLFECLKRFYLLVGFIWMCIFHMVLFFSAEILYFSGR